MSPTVTCSALHCNTCSFSLSPMTQYENSHSGSPVKQKETTRLKASHTTWATHALQCNLIQVSNEAERQTDWHCVCLGQLEIYSGENFEHAEEGRVCVGFWRETFELWVWRDAIVWVSKSFDVKLLSCCLVEGWVCVGSFYPHPCHQPLIEHHHEEDGDSVFVNVFVFVFDSVLLRMVTFTLYSTKTTLKFCCKVLLHTCVNNLYNFLAIVS